METPANHDIVAIGGSAGAFDTLVQMVKALPRELRAAVFVVLHTAPGRSVLPDILSRAGQLPAIFPLHDETIQLGHIYVAPPDTQLMLYPGTMQVVRGPRENGHRPAADALFRTAAMSYGPRVIGVVLSGYLDCGTAGMMSIKARGGVSVVQDPRSAAAASMPQSVIDCVTVDHVATPDELGPLIGRLVETQAAPTVEPDPLVQQLEGSELGVPAGIVCPVCNGAMTYVGSGDFEHYRCHVGHAFSLESLIYEQGEAIERALWSAVRSLEEGAALSKRLAGGASNDLGRRFAERARSQQHDAERIRSVLLKTGRSGSGRTR